MVLDPGPTHIADAAVDDDDLPMVEVAEVVQAPVDATLTEEPVEVQERALVRHDLHADRIDESDEARARQIERFWRTVLEIHDDFS